MTSSGRIRRATLTIIGRQSGGLPELPDRPIPIAPTRRAAPEHSAIDSGSASNARPAASLDDSRSALGASPRGATWSTYPPETESIKATSGRNNATTMNPTIPPRHTIMMGSSSETRLATAVSTSSS